VTPPAAASVSAWIVNSSPSTPIVTVPGVSVIELAWMTRPRSERWPISRERFLLR